MTNSETLRECAANLACLADQAQDAQAEIEAAVRSGALMRDAEGNTFNGLTPDALGRIAGVLANSRDALRLLAGAAAQTPATDTLQ